MRTHKRRFVRVVGFVLLGCVFFASGFIFTQTNVTRGATTTYLLANYDLDKMVERSDLIIGGEILSISDPFWDENMISKKRWTAKRQLLMKKIPFGNSPSYGDRKRYKPPPYFYSTAFPCVCYQNLANTGERRRVFFPAFSCKKREKRSVLNKRFRLPD